MFQGAKVPGSESSTCGTFAPRSWERKYVGMKVPVTVSIYNTCTYMLQLMVAINNSGGRQRNYSSFNSGVLLSLLARGVNLDVARQVIDEWCKHVSLIF